MAVNPAPRTLILVPCPLLVLPAFLYLRVKQRNMSTPHSLSSSTPYSWEAYLTLEAESEERYEYHDGEIVAMAGATNRHNKIIGRTYAKLLIATDQKGCDVFFENVRLLRYQSERYLYPDLMVTCNPLDLQAKHGVRSPVLIMEVLSKSNTHKQLTFKLQEYLKLPSLRHYLLVNQEVCLVEHYRRNEEGRFEIFLYDQLDQLIDLPELGLQISLADLYAGIEFGPEITEAEEAAAKYGEG
jgi:Uma2 family endonuclease